MNHQKNPKRCTKLFRKENWTTTSRLLQTSESSLKLVKTKKMSLSRNWANNIFRSSLKIPSLQIIQDSQVLRTRTKVLTSQLPWPTTSTSLKKLKIRGKMAISTRFWLLLRKKRNSLMKNSAYLNLSWRISKVRRI